MKHQSRPRKALFGLSTLLLIAAAQAASADGPFALGDLAVSLVDSGNGNTASLNTTATRLRVTEFRDNGATATTTGMFYNLPGLSGEGSVGGNFLTVAGTAAQEGRLNLTPDGRFLIVTGFNAVIGATGGTLTDPNNTSNTRTLALFNSRSPVGANGTANTGGIARVIGLINWRTAATASAVNTSTAVNNAFDSGDIFSAQTLDGTNFFLGGTSALSLTTTSGAATYTVQVDPNDVTSGLRTVTLGGTTSTQLEGGSSAAGPGDIYQVFQTNLSQGRLHIVDSTGRLDGSATFNPGIPTSPTAATKEVETSSTNVSFTNTNLETAGAGAGTLHNTSTSFATDYEIFFADPDTAYVADARGYDSRNSTTGTTNTNGRFFVTLNASADGGKQSDPNTQYFLQNGGGLYKFTRNPATNTWSATPAYHILLPAVNPTTGAPVPLTVNDPTTGATTTQNALAGLRSVTGTRNASGQVVLYGITSDNSLVKLTDTGSSATFTRLYTAPAGQILRGVAYLRPTLAAQVSLTGLSSAGVGNNGIAPSITADYRTPGTLTTVASRTDVPFPNGQFFAESLVGTYDVRLKGSNTLAVSTPNVALPNTAMFPYSPAVSVALSPGDANGDNSVDTLDFNLLSSSFNLAAGPFLQGMDDPGFVRGADFNYDGAVDTLDFNLLASNFNNTGDE